MTRIGLLGATGYTGKLVAAELVRRHLPARLGGRNQARLDGLQALPAGATEPGAEDVEFAVVDVTDPVALDRFLEGLDAVISCVGPFSDLGLPVVEAAVRAGVAYVDSAGEPAFMEQVYARFGSPNGSPSPVVPACGFDYLPGDLAAFVAAGDLGSSEPSTLTVAYRLSGVRPSRGTARSALGVLTGVKGAVGGRQVAFPDGLATVFELPWGEQLTIPRWAPSTTVVTGIAVQAPVPPRWLGSARSVLTPVAGAAQAISRPLLPFLHRVVDRLPEGPDEAARGRGAFTVVAVASDGARRTGVVCDGTDIYGLTARFLVEAALQAGGAGALTPAQALDPVPFLEAVSDDGAAAGGPGTFAWHRYSPT